VTPDDQPTVSEEALAVIRDACARLAPTDLRVAVAVHRANCRQSRCPVLAAMEARLAEAP
jgi:hypothetical protein